MRSLIKDSFVSDKKTYATVWDMPWTEQVLICLSNWTQTHSYKLSNENVNLKKEVDAWERIIF